MLAAHLIAVDAFKLSQGVVATRASPPCPFRSSFPSGYCRYDRRSRSVATRAVPPQAETRCGWREIWLDGRAPGSKSDARSLVQNFERGASVLQLDGVASDAECLALVEAAKKRAAAGTVRIPSMAAARRKVRQIGGTEEDLSPLPDAADATAEAIFQRVLTRIEDELPSLVTTLFSTDETSKCNLTARHATGTLLFNNMEPAVNVYTNKGLMASLHTRIAWHSQCSSRSHRRPALQAAALDSGATKQIAGQQLCCVRHPGRCCCGEEK